MDLKWVYVSLIIIVSMSTYNLFDDSSEKHHHEDFFVEVRFFMEEINNWKNEGGRNTSKMGNNICEYANKINKNPEIEALDCYKIYGNTQ